MCHSPPTSAMWIEALKLTLGTETVVRVNHPAMTAVRLQAMLDCSCNEGMSEPMRRRLASARDRALASVAKMKAPPPPRDPVTADPDRPGLLPGGAAAFPAFG